MFVHPAEGGRDNRDTTDDNKEEVDGADVDTDDDNKEDVSVENNETFLFTSKKDTCDGSDTACDVVDVRPELAGRILSPADDDEEEDISEPSLELCEGHWVVWVTSLVIVGKVRL